MKIFLGAWRKVTLVNLQTDAGAEVIGILHNCLLPDVLDLSVIALDLKQTVQVDKDLVIRAYYAGHVCSLYFLIIPYYVPLFYKFFEVNIDLVLCFLI